ncbi:glycosyltransferase [Kocuria flava]|uniref:glycosyltransferase n=1 Tax=Kocuria flava TaxID=446860 RepID=UPI001FF68332|nr:glycosyltransferase [Kocuria flava]MCJ8505657.1 glycosyltransferase [Kocuria flava]
MIIAVVPALRAGARIGRTLAALRRQSRPLERIVVVCDDAADAAVAPALDAGTEVLLTVDNAAHEAGALNQVLDAVRMAPEDLVLVLDADAELPVRFLEEAVTALRDRNVGAVPVRRAPGEGAAAVVRRQALEEVRATFGRYWDEGPVSGHGRLALDLETLGWRLGAPVAVPGLRADDGPADRGTDGQEAAALEPMGLEPAVHGPAAHGTAVPAPAVEGPEHDRAPEDVHAVGAHPAVGAAA